MDLVAVKIKTTAVTARYGTLSTDTILRTDAAYAKHLVDDCDAAEYVNSSAATGEETALLRKQEEELQAQRDAEDQRQREAEAEQQRQREAEEQRQREADAEQQRQRDADAAAELARQQEADAAELAQREKDAAAAKKLADQGNGSKGNGKK